MTDLTSLLYQIDKEPSLTEELFIHVYDELRKLAAAKIMEEDGERTLQATALVHEAFVRLVDNEQTLNWENRAHFFGAAAEAMRRILVDHARKRNAKKRGKDFQKSNIQLEDISNKNSEERILIAVSDALDALRSVEPSAYDLVKLKYYAGLSHREAAETLGLPLRTADRLWSYAKAWMAREITQL